MTLALPFSLIKAMSCWKKFEIPLYPGCIRTSSISKSWGSLLHFGCPLHLSSQSLVAINSFFISCSPSLILDLIKSGQKFEAQLLYPIKRYQSRSYSIRVTYNVNEHPLQLKPIVTQCAAVNTYWSPIRAPPHCHFALPVILPLLGLVYPSSASQGYSPIGTSDPPTILVNLCFLIGHPSILAKTSRLTWLLNL